MTPPLIAIAVEEAAKSASALDSYTAKALITVLAVILGIVAATPIAMQKARAERYSEFRQKWADAVYGDLRAFMELAARACTVKRLISDEHLRFAVEGVAEADVGLRVELGEITRSSYDLQGRLIGTRSLYPKTAPALYAAIDAVVEGLGSLEEDANDRSLQALSVVSGLARKAHAEILDLRLRS